MRTPGVARELLALEENGKIIPKRAVEWARRNTNSELHSALEWDDAVAGEAYRIAQVRQLISVFVLPEQAGARQFVSLSVDRVDGGGYRRMEQVLHQPDLRTVLLQDAFNDLERMRAKYSMLQELARVWEAAEAARKRPPRVGRGRPKRPR